MESSMSINKLRVYLALSQQLVKPSYKQSFLTFRTRLVFAKLGQTFIELLILYYFDLEYDVLVETNALSYAISKIFNQLALDNLGEQYQLAFFLGKMIQPKT